MKRFDAVKTMRDIRTRLSERYQDDGKRQSEDLRRIREKYCFPQSKSFLKRTAVTEDESEYGVTDSE